jgi:hypothetical protein
VEGKERGEKGGREGEKEERRSQKITLQYKTRNCIIVTCD